MDSKKPFRELPSHPSHQRYDDHDTNNITGSLHGGSPVVASVREVKVTNYEDCQYGH
jgi:hypothetical protein